MSNDNRTAFFIGTPNDQEQELLGIVRDTHQIYMLDSPSLVYEYMAMVVPDMIMFSVNQADTSTLTLFRQLRRVEGMRLIVCEDQDLQLFSGRRYHGRYSPPKSVEELEILLL
jgi:hypothetical protein